MFSENNLEKYYYVMSNQEYIEWKMFLDMFYKEAEKYIKYDTLFYQGSLDRLVHGSLSFENIKYDSFTGEIHFINPSCKKNKIAWVYNDYANLYYSCISGVYPIKAKMYEYDGSQITIKKSIFDNMKRCEQALDDMFSKEESEMLKMFSIIILLDEISMQNFEPEISTALFKYAKQIKDNLYWNKIVSI